MTKRKLMKFATFLVAGIVFAMWNQLPPQPVRHSEQSVSGAEETSKVSPLAALGRDDAATTTVVTNALVTRDVDGDTVEVKLDTGEEAKIRLLGVDTPESVDPRKTVQCFAKEASKHTKEMLEGKRVRLEEDPQADNIDKYGRLLRNIILADGTDYNASLVSDGYAHAYLSFPLNKQRKVQLANLQKEAEAAGRGLWNAQTCAGKP